MIFSHSLDLQNGAKLPQFHSSPLSIKRQQQQPKLVAVSCRSSMAKETANLYKVLSLNPNKAVSIDEVKKAYRSMALRYHPDVCNYNNDPSIKEESTRMFLQLHTAYKTLSDPVLREEYDFRCYSTSFGDHNNIGDQTSRRRTRKWQYQVAELKRRSNYRMAQKEGSWGMRMRAQNMQN